MWVLETRPRSCLQEQEVLLVPSQLLRPTLFFWFGRVSFCSPGQPRANPHSLCLSYLRAEIPGLCGPLSSNSVSPSSSGPTCFNYTRLKVQVKFSPVFLLQACSGDSRSATLSSLPEEHGSLLGFVGTSGVVLRLTGRIWPLMKRTFHCQPWYDCVYLVFSFSLCSFAKLLRYIFVKCAPHYPTVFVAKGTFLILSIPVSAAVQSHYLVLCILLNFHLFYQCL